MKEKILEELDSLLDANTVAFLSIEIKQRADGEYLVTVSEFGLENLTEKARAQLSTATVHLGELIGKIK